MSEKEAVKKVLAELKEHNRSAYLIAGEVQGVKRKFHRSNLSDWARGTRAVSEGMKARMAREIQRHCKETGMEFPAELEKYVSHGRAKVA